MPLSQTRAGSTNFCAYDNSNTIFLRNNTLKSVFLFHIFNSFYLLSFSALPFDLFFWTKKLIAYFCKYFNFLKKQTY